MRSALTVAPGQPFSSAAVVASREAVLRRYLDEGYRQAQIEARLDNGASTGAIGVTFVLVEGRQTIVDRILVVGNVRTSEDTIRRELRIASGQPFGLSRVFESQRRLTALGLFRSVRIVDVGQANAGCARRRHHGRGGAGHDGGLRRGAAGRATPAFGRRRRCRRGELRVRGARFLRGGPTQPVGKEPRRQPLRARQRSAARFPAAIPSATAAVSRSTSTACSGAWREPRAFLDSANLDVAAFVEQAIRSSFSFRRQQARVDWSRLFGEHLTFVARYGFGRTDIFDARIAPEDQLNVDRLFPQVRISSVTNSVIRDTRDDPLDPGKGTFVAVDGELAGRAIGSEVGFGKTLLQGFLYRRLAGPRRVVIAGGAQTRPGARAAARNRPPRRRRPAAVRARMASRSSTS